MKLFIILFLFSSIFAYSDTRRIEGKIIIKDENNPEIIFPIDDMRPFLSVELEYYVNNHQRQSCGYTFNVDDNWRFVADIHGYCNSTMFYGKELYLIPNLKESNLPKYWRLEEPPPHIKL